MSTFFHGIMSFMIIDAFFIVLGSATLVRINVLVISLVKVVVNPNLYLLQQYVTSMKNQEISATSDFYRNFGLVKIKHLGENIALFSQDINNQNCKSGCVGRKICLSLGEINTYRCHQSLLHNLSEMSIIQIQ